MAKEKWEILPLVSEGGNGCEMYMIRGHVPEPIALDEFKESFYNPNKQMLESNFAVSTSIVHDRSFILYKNMRGESCKHIG